MGGQVDELVMELKALRREHGIGTVDLKAHTGSRLRAAAGVVKADLPTRSGARCGRWSRG